MIKFIALLGIIFLTACSKINVESEVADQCLRREITMQCIALANSKQTHTVTNGPSDIVNECQSMAYYQSIRKQSHVKPECSAGP